MKTKEGWETHKHPDPEFANLWADCPHCGREESFVLFREQTKAVVTCESGNSKDPRNCYIICYDVRSAKEPEVKKMTLWHNDCEWVVAASPEDATKVLAETHGSPIS